MKYKAMPMMHARTSHSRHGSGLMHPTPLPAGGPIMPATTAAPSMGPTMTQPPAMGFAAGGMPMTTQADGAPIEVPPGAQPSEVQDNVDAKLSHGEFVMPADEVRWHGLKSLMGMRDQAKKGLMSMQQQGLIQSPPANDNGGSGNFEQTGNAQPSFATGGLMSDPYSTSYNHYEGPNGPQLAPYIDPATGRTGYRYVDANGNPIAQNNSVYVPPRNIPNVSSAPTTPTTPTTGGTNPGGTGTPQTFIEWLRQHPGGTYQQYVASGGNTGTGSQMPGGNNQSVGQYAGQHGGYEGNTGANNPSAGSNSSLGGPGLGRFGDGLLRGALRFGGMLPGPIGYGIGALNAATDVNAAMQADNLRAALGLPSLTAGQYAGALIGDSTVARALGLGNGYGQGAIGSVNLGSDTPVQVSASRDAFGNLDASDVAAAVINGHTQMTLGEATNRQAALRAAGLTAGGGYSGNAVGNVGGVAVNAAGNRVSGVAGMANVGGGRGLGSGGGNGNSGGGNFGGGSMGGGGGAMGAGGNPSGPPGSH